MDSYPAFSASYKVLPGIVVAASFIRYLSLSDQYPTLGSIIYGAASSVEQIYQLSYALRSSNFISALESNSWFDNAVV